MNRSLTKEIQVAGHGGWKDKLMMSLAIIGMIAGFILLTEGIQTASILLIISCIAFIAGLIISNARFVRRAWLRDTGTGFIYRDSKKSHMFLDNEVVDLQSHFKVNFVHSIPQSVSRYIELTLVDRVEKLQLNHTVQLGHSDPLADFFNRQTAALCERANEVLATGAYLYGSNWSLGRHELVVSSKPPRKIPVDELVAIEDIDQHFKVWRQDEEHPCLRVPINSENAFLLNLVLEPLIAKNTQHLGDDWGQPGLGRMLFHRTPGLTKRVASCLSILLGIAFVWTGVHVYAMRETDGTVFSLMGAIFVFFGIACLVSDFRCHERGVYLRNLFGKHELRYDDIETFSCTAIRHYEYLVLYMSTGVTLKFKAKNSSGKKSVRYVSIVRNPESIDKVRDFVSRILMTRMAQELSQTGSVRWSSNLGISTEGLHYRPKGLTGRGEERVMPFEDVSRFEIEEGVFYLWRDGEDKFVTSENVSEPNFFPGYYLFLTLAKTTQEPANS